MSECPAGDYAVVVGPCGRHPELFRWTILRRGQPLDLDGYAYATRWMAERAGTVALECQLIRDRRQDRNDREGTRCSRAVDTRTS